MFLSAEHRAQAEPSTTGSAYVACDLRERRATSEKSSRISAELNLAAERVA
jgi:hypothetical protein